MCLHYYIIIISIKTALLFTTSYTSHKLGQFLILTRIFAFDKDS